MRIQFKLIAFVIFLFGSSSVSLADDTEYYTGGEQFRPTWYAFYVEGNHEPDLPTPLIEMGKPMVPAIVEAISHLDMKRRRYAISALGSIGDRRAVPALKAILENRNEIYYFRGDALWEIYRIDHALGVQLAAQFENEHEFLKYMADGIRRSERSSLEGTKK